MTTRAKRFPKPTFADLLQHYQTDAETVHVCSILNPTPEYDGINTCAARLSEALVLSNRLVADRPTIQKSKKGRDGVYPLLGGYGYGPFGNLCAHGIARGARDLGEFLMHQWGAPSFSWTSREDAPAEISQKTGVLCFVKIPGYDGQGHVDVWNKTGPVGSAYWNAQKIWFWSLT